MSYGRSLVEDNIHFLRQGIDLLKEISDKQYISADSPYYKSGVGVHMRHILDHYLSLTNLSGARIDYDARERDGRIETDKSYASSIAEQIVTELNTFLNDAALIEREVQVKSNEGGSESENPWTASSIKRELQFLISHTVHHYALIAIILRIQGYHPPEKFGIAPSTLEYRKRKSV